jgi:hypothetical protein
VWKFVLFDRNACLSCDVWAEDSCDCNDGQCPFRDAPGKPSDVQEGDGMKVRMAHRMSSTRVE